jgi:hypothetical protein
MGEWVYFYPVALTANLTLKLTSGRNELSSEWMGLLDETETELINQ